MTLETWLTWRLLLVFSVTPFKIDQNKNQNRSIDKVQNLGNEYPGYQRFFLACDEVRACVRLRLKTEDTSDEAARKNLWRIAP